MPLVLVGGDSLVVHVVEDLEFFEECCRGCRHKLYQIKKHDSIVIVRLRAGSIAFEKTLDLKREDDKKEFDRIKDFIEREGFVEVKKVIPDDEFFT